MTSIKFQSFLIILDFLMACFCCCIYVLSSCNIENPSKKYYVGNVFSREDLVIDGLID